MYYDSLKEKLVNARKEIIEEYSLVYNDDQNHSDITLKKIQEREDRANDTIFGVIPHNFNYALELMEKNEQYFDNVTLEIKLGMLFKKDDLENGTKTPLSEYVAIRGGDMYLRNTDFEELFVDAYDNRYSGESFIKYDKYIDGLIKDGFYIDGPLTYEDVRELIENGEQAKTSISVSLKEEQVEEQEEVEEQVEELVEEKPIVRRRLFRK